MSALVPNLHWLPKAHRICRGRRQLGARQGLGPDVKELALNLVLRKWSSFPQRERKSEEPVLPTFLDSSWSSFIAVSPSLCLCQTFSPSRPPLVLPLSLFCVSNFSFSVSQSLLFNGVLFGSSKSSPIPPSLYPHSHPHPHPQLCLCVCPHPIPSFLPPPGFKDDQPLRVRSFPQLF